MAQSTINQTETIGGDWSIAGIERQIDRLKGFYIEDASPGSIVNIDCGSVEEIDYSGFQLLYVWSSFIREKGLRCELVNIPEKMWEEQVRLGLDQVLLHGR